MTERRKLVAVIAVSAAAVLIVAVGAAAVGWLSERDDDTVVTQGPGTNAETDDSDAETETDDDVNGEMSMAGGDVVPEPMGGQEAIDELGDKLAIVAERNNMSEEDLRDLLLRDKTVKVTPGGFLAYIDTATPEP